MKFYTGEAITDDMEGVEIEEIFPELIEEIEFWVDVVQEDPVREEIAEAIFRAQTGKP